MGITALIPLLGVLITIVVVVGSVFFMFKVLGGLGKAEAERQRLIATGIPARARILQVTPGGMTVQTGGLRQLQLHISVEVHRPNMAPYPGQITSLISELQIPQIQPGSWLAVRIDPMNPAVMAIEATGVSGDLSMIPAGGPGAAAYRAQPQMGFGPHGPMATPVQGFKLPMAAKIGLVIGLLGAVLGIGGAIVATVWTSGIGGSSDTCKEAAACCRKMAGSSPAASNCDNYLKQTGPIADQVCEQTLKSYKQSGLCK